MTPNKLFLQENYNFPICNCVGLQLCLICPRNTNQHHEDFNNEQR